jgi:signal transduction histidine kinase
VLPIKFVHSWTFRVVAIYAALFAVSVLTLLGFIYVTTVGFIDRQINETIATEANGLYDQYREHGLNGLIQVINERIAADRFGDSIYLVTDPEYQTVVGNLKEWPRDMARRNRYASFPADRPGQEEGTSDTLQVRASSYVLSEGFHLLVGRNLRERQSFETLIVTSLFWSLIVTAGLALFGGLIMSRDMRRRLEAINRTAQQIIHGDLTRRMPVVGTDDEFDRLSLNLNDMLNQIDRLMHAMREVSDNVAHDLRSPLTRLKSRLELTLFGHGNPDQYRQAIEQAVTETDKILSTFNALLSIAQAEAGAGRGDMEILAADTLCADVAELYEPLAEAQSLGFVTDLKGPAPLSGNRHLLFQAVANLLDNAFKYAGRGGAIELAVRPLGDMVEIVVADGGPGIPEADREHVLRRFVRLESSRTTPGNGLGLSLVSAVASLHQGSFTLEDNQPGLRAVLRLPARPALKLAG